MDRLEKEFNEDMLQIYIRAKKEIKYNATRFLQLVNEKGGLQAAKQLIAKEGGSDGFRVLWENNRLDLSVEAHVIKPEYMPLFSKEEIDNCKRLLEKVKYNV